MTAFPVIERELRLAARGRAVYLNRYITAIVAATAPAFSLLWSMSMVQLSGSPGRFLFISNSFVAAIYCLTAGLFWTINCVSQEKRDGTLGLLFLTRLGSMDILLGKLAANALPALFGFLTIFPLIALAFCLGGMNPDQFIEMAVALLNLLTFSLVLGLFVSSATAIPGVAIILFAAFMLLPSITGTAQLLLTHAKEIAPVCLTFNPVYPVLVAFGFTIAGLPRSYAGTALLTTQAINVLLVFAAALLMQRSIRSREWNVLSFLNRLPKKQSRNRLNRALEKHPLMYLGLRKSSALGPLTISIALGVALYFFDPLGAEYPEYRGFLYPLMLHYFLKWLIAWHAGKALFAEKENGFFEILLSTPVNPGVILHGKRLALRRDFMALMVLAVLAHLWFIINAIAGDGLTPACWIVLASLIVLFLDYFALIWIGLWQGLMRPNPHRAFLNTLFFGLVAPWLPYLLLSGLVWFVVGENYGVEYGLLFSVGIVSASVFALAIGLWGLAQAHFRFRHRIASGPRFLDRKEL